MPLNVSPLPIIALATSDKSFTFTALLDISLLADCPLEISARLPDKTFSILFSLAPSVLDVTIPLSIFLICLLPKSNPASLNVNLVVTPPLVFPNVNSILSLTPLLLLVGLVEVKEIFAPFASLPL